jgi:hypothetical protein
MPESEYNKTVRWIKVLEEVSERYPYKNIDNVIMQLKSIKKELEKQNAV